MGKQNLAVNQLLERKDYRINLISAHDIRHTENFRTCLQYIFGMLKYNKDKKGLYEYITLHKEKLQQMDRVETMAALILLGEQKRVEALLRDGQSQGKEEVNMCKAIDDLIRDGEERGALRGKAEGKIEGKIEGETRALALIHALISDGKQHLIGRVTEDGTLREQLYQQYQV